MAKIGIHVRLEPDLVAVLDKLARRLGETRTSVIERAIGLGLDDVGRAADLVSGPLMNRLMRVVAQLSNEADKEDLIRMLDRFSDVGRVSLPGMEVGR